MTIIRERGRQRDLEREFVKLGVSPDCVEVFARCPSNYRVSLDVRPDHPWAEDPHSLAPIIASILPAGASYSLDLLVVLPIRGWRTYHPSTHNIQAQWAYPTSVSLPTNNDGPTNQAYADLSDFANYGGLGPEATANLDDSIITLHLHNASSIADSYLRSAGYQLPLTNWGDLLRRGVCHLAAWTLYAAKEVTLDAATYSKIVSRRDYVIARLAEAQEGVPGLVTSGEVSS